MKKLRVFEAFAGIGSQRMALEKLGVDYEVVGIAEIDKFAIESYKAIHSECINFGDISKINPIDLPDMDLFTYSFPCQDLSKAGKMKGLTGNTRSGLLYECEKVIEAKRPKYLILENVATLVSKRFKEDFEKWLEYLRGLGYTNYWKLINAKDFGVPQNRERVFVVSILDDNCGYEFEPSIPLNIKACEMLEDNVDQKFYTENNLEIEGGKVIIPQATKKGYIEMELGGICDLTYPNSKTRRGRVQGGGSICPTLTAAQQAILFIDNKGRARKLTPLEYWRLMGFDDEAFYKAKRAGISDAQLYKQAGNSIVLNALMAVMKPLFKHEPKHRDASSLIKQSIELLAGKSCSFEFTKKEREIIKKIKNGEFEIKLK